MVDIIKTYWTHVENFKRVNFKSKQKLFYCFPFGFFLWFFHVFIQCNRIKYLPELFQQYPNYSNTTCFLPILLLLMLLIFWFIYFTGGDVWVCRQVEMRGPLSGDCSLLTSGRSRYWTQVFGTRFLSLLRRLLSNFHFLYYYYFWIIIWGHLVLLTWTQLQEHSLKHG